MPHTHNTTHAKRTHTTRPTHTHHARAGLREQPLHPYLLPSRGYPVVSLSVFSLAGSLSLDADAAPCWSDNGDLPCSQLLHV